MKKEQQKNEKENTSYSSYSQYIVYWNIKIYSKSFKFESVGKKIYKHT